MNDSDYLNSETISLLTEIQESMSGRISSNISIKSIDLIEMHKEFGSKIIAEKLKQIEEQFYPFNSISMGVNTRKEKANTALPHAHGYSSLTVPGTLGNGCVSAMCFAPVNQPTMRSMPIPAPAHGFSLPSFANFSTSA